MSTVTEARDGMNLVLRTAWLANGTTSPIALFFDDVHFDKPQEDANGKALPYAVVTIRHTTGGADTLGGVGIGKQLHEGRIVVQIFTPAGFGHVLGDQIAQIVKKVLQQNNFSTDGWFFGVTILERGQTGNYNGTDVVAGFRYTETL